MSAPVLFGKILQKLLQSLDGYPLVQTHPNCPFVHQSALSSAKEHWRVLGLFSKREVQILIKTNKLVELRQMAKKKTKKNPIALGRGS